MRAKEHIPIGILAPWLVLIAYIVLFSQIPLAFSENSWFFVTISFVSFIGERIPDTVEPPKNPKHRALFHFMGVLAFLYVIIFFGTAPILPFTTISYNSLTGLLAISFLSGYASHFVLDCLTP